MIAVPVPAMCGELAGHVAVEGRLFFESPRLDEQRSHGVSLVFQPEYRHQWERGTGFAVVPFARYDSADSERTHFDIRELNCFFAWDHWELRVGVGKVFWGVTEFVHLVDIINQTDAIESVDLEAKLGQPMVQVSSQTDRGVLSAFVLPYFRERTFPGKKGRLRYDIPIDTDNAIYESADEEHHLDFAVRYSHSMGAVDFGLYYFRGTGREPWFVPEIGPMMQVRLNPYYEQIDQVGVDLQFVNGQCLFKLESIARYGQINYDFQEDDFIAAVAGFEYTFVRIADTDMDLGLLGEWAYDERRNKATTWYQNDVMLGFRVAVNDAPSTEFLVWMGHDLDFSTKTLNLEAARRFGDNWKLNLEIRAFFDPSKKDILYSFRDDDYFRFDLACFF